MAGRGALLLVGFSLNVLDRLRGVLADGSVLVVEEPDVVRKRELRETLGAHPEIGGLAEVVYQDAAALDALLPDPRLATVRAVVPGVEYAVVAAARLSERLRLPGAGARAAAVFRDKHALRRLAERAGLPNPSFALVRTPEEAAAFVARHDTRCVLKPTARQASLGVQFVESGDDLAAAWAGTVEVDEGALVPDRGIPSQVLVETAALGDEYSVEMLVADGVPCFANVTAKSVLTGRFPVEAGHVLPAAVEERTWSTLVELTARLAAAAGFDTGVLHAEWIHGDDGPCLVECAARMPGDEIPALVDSAWDFPFMAAYVECLLGRRPRCPDQAVRAAAIRFLFASGGTVTAVDGVDVAQTLPGVERVTVAVAPGRTIAAATRSSWDRAGHVIASGATADEAWKAASVASERVTIRTEPPRAV